MQPLSLIHIFVFGAMMSGFNEKCYDGLSFFNTAHKVGDATYSNRSNKKLSRGPLSWDLVAARTLLGWI